MQKKEKRKNPLKVAPLRKSLHCQAGVRKVTPVEILFTIQTWKILTLHLVYPISASSVGALGPSPIWIPCYQYSAVSCPGLGKLGKFQKSPQNKGLKMAIYSNSVLVRIRVPIRTEVPPTPVLHKKPSQKTFTNQVAHPILHAFVLSPCSGLRLTTETFSFPPPQVCSSHEDSKAF